MNTPITINNINTTPNIYTGTDIILATVIRYNRRPIINQKKHCTTRLHIQHTKYIRKRLYNID